MRQLSEVLQDWEAIIGLEIHTELTTLETKMFCGCKLSHDDEPNANVCPICLGMPGALPVPNEKSIASTTSIPTWQRTSRPRRGRSPL